MCRKLAHKYNRPNDFDDIVSEGAIVCLELRAEDPEVHPAKLYREANRAMHDYINLSLQPVSIPKHNVARRLSHDINDEETGNMSEDGGSFSIGGGVLDSFWFHDSFLIRSKLPIRIDPKMLSMAQKDSLQGISDRARSATPFGLSVA